MTINIIASDLSIAAPSASSTAPRALFDSLSPLRALLLLQDKLSMAQALGANGTKFKGRELRVTKVSKKPRRDKPGSSFEGVRSGHVPRSLGKLGVGAKRRKEEKARRNARSDRNAIKKIAQHAKAARKASTKGKGRR